MSLNKFYVYVHRRADDNTIFYVGKGCNDRAWHKRGRSDWWQNVVNKHGYTVEIVIDFMDEDVAFSFEEELTNYYDGHLVNLSVGGGGSTGYKFTEQERLNRSIISKSLWQTENYRQHFVGKKHTEEHRKKNSEAMKKAWPNDTIRDKILSNLRTVMCAKWQDPAHREKMAKVIKGKPAKPVRRSDGMLFNSASAAAEHMGKRVQSISRAALGQRAKAHGYGWEYM